MNFRIETHMDNTGISYIKVIDTDTGRWTGSSVKEGQFISKLVEKLKDELRKMNLRIPWGCVENGKK